LKNEVNECVFFDDEFHVIHGEENDSSGGARTFVSVHEWVVLNDVEEIG
jgi:hypothetical protein